jgi:hypothetical protein
LCFDHILLFNYITVVYMYPSSTRRKQMRMGRDQPLLGG